MKLFTIAAVAVISLFDTVSANNNFVYNTDETGNESTKYVYRLDDSGKYLTNHLQYNFTYDEQGRILTKQAYSWNTGKQLWEPYYQMYYRYNNLSQGYTVEYARWDAKTESYSAGMEKATYGMDDANQLVCYQGYKWDKQTQEWNIVQDFGELAFSGELYAQR